MTEVSTVFLGLHDAICQDRDGSTLQPFLRAHLAEAKIGDRIIYDIGSAIFLMQLSRRNYDVHLLARDALTMTSEQIMESTYDYVRSERVKTAAELAAAVR